MKTGANLIQFLSMSATLTTQGSTDSGAIDVDSSSAGSVSMIGSDTISGSGGLNIYNCASSGGTCTNSVTSIGNNQTTRPVPVSTAVPDPLLTTLTAPPSPASPGSCTGPNGSLTSSITANDTPITCTAGLYSSGLNISGTGDTITFTNQGVSNAVFQFGKACKNSKCATTGLTVAGPQDTLNFQNGTYLFEGATSDAGTCTTAGSLSDLNQGGISISGGGDILQDKGAGVFFYVAGGPADFGCVASENTIDLSPMTSGTYQGVLLFVNRATSTPVVLDGFSTSGTIYAPDSAVESFGTSTNTTGSLIVQYLVVNENVTIA